MTPTVRTEARRMALLGWTAVTVPIVAWMLHLIFSAAYVASAGRGRIGASSACRTGAAVWPLHLGTVVGVVTCLASLALAAFVHQHRNGSGEGDASSQYRFLGLLGIASSVFNLVLIVAEGSVVLFLWSCG
jgi:hypothetical protein